MVCAGECLLWGGVVQVVFEFRSQFVGWVGGCLGTNRKLWEFVRENVCLGECWWTQHKDHIFHHSRSLFLTYFSLSVSHMVLVSHTLVILSLSIPLFAHLFLFPPSFLSLNRDNWAGQGGDWHGMSYLNTHKLSTVETRMTVQSLCLRLCVSCRVPFCVCMCVCMSVYSISVLLMFKFGSQAHVYVVHT